MVWGLFFAFAVQLRCTTALRAGGTLLRKVVAIPEKASGGWHFSSKSCPQFNFVELQPSGRGALFCEEWSQFDSVESL